MSTEMPTIGPLHNRNPSEVPVHEVSPALPLPEPLASAGFTPEQKEYLTGLFAGIAARGQGFTDVEPSPVPKQEDLIFEERVKRELHPLDAYEQIVENARGNKAPDKEEVFRFKWNGLFFLTPVKDAFMARLRIPGGVLRTYQLRELAHIAQELTTGYVQITTRANLQLRLIQPKDAAEVLRRVQSVGLHTRGAGADNIRNLTMNPTAGIDPIELIDVQPFIQELAHTIINDRSFYDLPRKFNIAYDGGGFIGAVEDTNDIGVKAVKVGEEILFRIALGGATGHKTFARDLGIIIPPSEINKTVLAVLRIFIERGCRTDRKKARLKHLLEKMSLEQYLAEVEQKLETRLRRSPYEPAKVRWASQELPHSHVGEFPQKQRGFHYVGATCAVGQVTPRQMLRLAELADSYGSGEVRLTVWQNFIIPNVPDAFVATLKRNLEKAGFATRQSNLASGVIACTGNTFCKFAQSNTKSHALELIKRLEKRIELDQPVNIHITGCPNSCAQHYMGDIGCLGTKARIGGESVDAYHVFVGGGFGGKQAVGRQVYTGVAAIELSDTLERILRAYLRRRDDRESFQQFTGRHDLRTLQEIFAE
jgi:ferredoxin-nitrite reductase